ncbi:bifunctional diguanylate cyclase/phosphodiesterase [Acidipila sp. EB88]|uniref:putative bifunctional diguanylate cyclase/phosphodiesterase n=1 Tax=Acidipila sp. EB88 TaxID=2305226 RepID=UPI000F5E9812|nr:bifunctional diguanylate cyclase/phosphodiesterase [Acidipila sp. EB88]RRA49723.1 bifunctional diguanylate cyclase/phosphodiesterase [Acidipila sp. EB88]
MSILSEDVMYRLLVQSVTDYAIYLLSLDGFVLNWNAGAQRCEGYRADEIIGQHFSIFYTEEERAQDLPQQALRTALHTGGFETEAWRVRQDGSRFLAHVVLQPVKDEAGTTFGFAKIVRDLTEQRERESRVAEQERTFRLLVQGVTDYAIYMLSPGGIVSNWNAGAERTKGYRADEIVGQHFSRFYTPEDRLRGLPEQALATAMESGRFEGEGWRLRKDGSSFWAHVVIDAIRDEQGAALGFAKITRDVTERKKIEDQMSHLAHHDVLTTLLNRAAFRDAVQAALRRDSCSVLIYLDLDRFKPVNDTLGHLAGDKVLQVVAERIAAQLRKTDVGGRLGGDEFAILLVDCESDQDAAAASERLIREIERPISIDGLTVTIGASAGVAFAGGEPCTPEMLLHNADLALYAAKREKRGTYRRYEPGMDIEIAQHKALESDLRAALGRNEFSLHYQAVVHASSNAVTGYEALLRWNSPTRGQVLPADFIPYAEQHGLMVEIGDWVLNAACVEASRWPDTLSISINVSHAQLRSPDFVRRIDEVLARTGVSPGRLELDITETAIISDLAAAQATLEELRARDILIAVDDFGSAHSSLSLLRTLPITRMKIDRSFVQELGKTEQSLAIVRALTGLCQSLGLATTAEGVETEEQRRLLRCAGCQDLQGYLVGRPASPPAFSSTEAVGVPEEAAESTG